MSEPTYVWVGQTATDEAEDRMIARYRRRRGFRISVNRPSPGILAAAARKLDPLIPVVATAAGIARALVVVVLVSEILGGR